MDQMADEEKTQDETTPDAVTPEDVVTPETEAAPEAPVRDSGPGEGDGGNREVPPAPTDSSPEEAVPVAEAPEDATPEAEAPDEPAAEEAPAAEAAPEPQPEVERKKRKRLPRALRHKHSKPEHTPSKERKPIVRTPRDESTPGRRQERRGVVVSDKGDKSIVVRVETIRIHAKYKKVVRRSNRLHAHDEQNAAGIGDVVRIVETRPLSKTKRWRLAEIVQKAR
jgi:small subunit ribosomal protein S17